MDSEALWRERKNETVSVVSPLSAFNGKKATA
jgi:hypothetical protein